MGGDHTITYTILQAIKVSWLLVVVVGGDDVVSLSPRGATTPSPTLFCRLVKVVPVVSGGDDVCSISLTRYGREGGDHTITYLILKAIKVSWLLVVVVVMV